MADRFLSSPKNPQLSQLKHDICCLQEEIDNIVIGDVTLTVGITDISGGSDGFILYDNGGVLGGLDPGTLGQGITLNQVLSNDPTNSSRAIVGDTFLNVSTNVNVPILQDDGLNTLIGVDSDGNVYLQDYKQGSKISFDSNTSIVYINHQLELTDNGSDVAPCLQIGDHNNDIGGLYRLDNARIGFSIGNTLVAGFSAAGLFANGFQATTDGSPSSPTILIGDSASHSGKNAGFYRIDTQNIGVTFNNGLTITLSSSGVIVDNISELTPGNGVNVIGSAGTIALKPITGYSAATGSVSKAAFATGSVTLGALAQAVGQHRNDLLNVVGLFHS